LAHALGRLRYLDAQLFQNIGATAL
jgi:hypothetical protein